MGKKWKDVMTFLESEGIEHIVMGETLMFHPVSMGTLLEIRSIGKPLAKAIGTLFADKTRDYGSVNRTVMQEGGKGADTEMIIEPIGIDLAKLRSTQKEESIEGMIESLTSDDSKKALGKIIMESVKQSEKFKDVEMPSPLEFMNSIPANSIVEFLTGVAKANKGVLGPLADTLTGLWAKAQTKIQKALSDDEDTETSSPTKDTVAEAPTSPTSEAAA